MPTANVAVTYTAADATTAQALTDAYNAVQLEIDDTWVDIGVKDYIGIVMTEGLHAKFLEQWKRDAQDTMNTAAGGEHDRLKADVTAVVT